MFSITRKEFKISDIQKCQYCENTFPKEFADRCLGYNGPEIYSLSELVECFGINWKDYDKKGQWYLWKDNFICPECAQKLIDSDEAKVIHCYKEYWTTCEYNKLFKDEKQYAKPHKTLDGKMMGSDIRIPYNILTKVRKTKK